jgi:hypothetical protein
LNLTLGAPLSDPCVPWLLDAEGRFVRDARQVAARVSPDEARLQIGDRRVPPADGALPHASGQPSPRRHPRPAAGADAVRRPGAQGPLRAVDAETRAAARRERLRTPDHFTGESGPEPYWTVERVIEHLTALPPGV